MCARQGDQLPGHEDRLESAFRQFHGWCHEGKVHKGAERAWLRMKVGNMAHGGRWQLAGRGAAHTTLRWVLTRQVPRWRTVQWEGFRDYTDGHRGGWGQWRGRGGRSGVYFPAVGGSEHMSEGTRPLTLAAARKLLWAMTMGPIRWGGGGARGGSRGTCHTGHAGKAAEAD